MNNGFDDFPEITDADSLRVDADSQLKTKKLKKHSDKHKVLKELAKALKKHNKLLKKAQQQRDKEQQRKQEEDKIKKNNCQNAKAFLTKLGDAVCKAVPLILKVFATAVIGCLLNRKPSTKNCQVA